MELPLPTTTPARKAARRHGSQLRRKRAALISRLKPALLGGAVISALLLFYSFFLSDLRPGDSLPGLIHRRLDSAELNRQNIVEEEQREMLIYGKLMLLASEALKKNETGSRKFELWEEPYKQARRWIPCSDKYSIIDRGDAMNDAGYIMVSANGGLNQQRVAICNAVAVAALLNATLILPSLLYSNVWKDDSQFGVIFQEDFFIDYLKEDVRIIKELPPHLQSLDIEAIGSQINENDIIKEATPAYYVEHILPLLRRNGVVHFVGFGNKLGFDPVPLYLQRLRCRCIFHALKFVPMIQKVGSLLVRRIRRFDSGFTELDKQLFGDRMTALPSSADIENAHTPARYLALHLRFEIDMVAYSLCNFGGGDAERRELQAYRELHFPALIERLRHNYTVDPEEQRSNGHCPLTPEESGLMLAALGYPSETAVYIAGAQVYGGRRRMQPFYKLYPNSVTKEDLLTSDELAPFKNHSSQLAALDFLACASADAFAMTDSGSQLSSLVAGYRIYHGRGRAPSLRPIRNRYARMLSESGIVEWDEFRSKVRRMIDDSKRVIARPKGRSVYRQPRTTECMCLEEQDDDEENDDLR